MRVVRKFRFKFDRESQSLLLDVDGHPTYEWFCENDETFGGAMNDVSRRHFAANPKWTGDRRGFELARGALLDELAKVFPNETFAIRYVTSENEGGDT